MKLSEHPDWIEADRLTAIQKKERGVLTEKRNGEKVEVPGPYVRTPEREKRAREIIRLRKAAAA